MSALSPELGLTALLLLGLALLHSCWTDLRARRIANGACLIAALAALPFWVGFAMNGHDAVVMQPLLCFAVSVPLLLLLWGAGVLGGGDVKLLAAMMLWMTSGTLSVLLFVTVMSGAAIGLLIASVGWLRRSPRRATVPYALAIALGAVVALAPAARDLAAQIR